MAKLKNYNGHYCESDYEYAFIAFLEREEWIYTPDADLKRKKKDEVLIAEDFKNFVPRTNKDLTEDEASQIYDKKRFSKHRFCRS